MEISITQVEMDSADAETGKIWDAYLANRPDATYYHTLAWKRVLERTFGYRPFYLMASETGRVRGVLPLFEVNSLFLGRFLSSIPCATYGGPVADEEEIAESLAEAAMRLAKERQVRYLEFRGGCLPLRGTQTLGHFVAFEKKLAPDPEEIWHGFTTDLRKHIRKASKSALTTRMGDHKLLPAFHRVYAHSVRDLGSPPQGLSYFNHILEEFAGSTSVLLVERSGETIGGCILLKHHGVLSIPFMTSLRKYFAYYPNHLLLWEALRYGCLQGLSTCDFGRSTVDTGPYNFKKQWGGRCISLPYQYYLVGKNSLPDVNPYNPSFQLLIKIWQHIPIPIAKAIGPALIRQLAE